ncbi:MAG: Ig-like domain-containing protein [Chloroflexota bacterium]|nr:Ig-like domain-containing protein [Chloroflexota bacterium]
MGRLREREQEKIRELVSAYLDGELPPDDAHFVGKRIQEDPAYAQVYAAYRGIRMDLRALTHPEVPASVSQTIRARAAVMQPGRAVLNIRQRVARITAAAATLAATFAAILTGGFGLQHHFTHAVPGTGQPNPVVIVANNNGTATIATILNPNIRYDESAQIRFTRPMNEQTALTSVVFSPTVLVSNLQYDKNTSILSTKPKALKPQTTYTVQIPAGLKDAEGNDVRADAFSFSVGNIIPGIADQPTTVPATVAASPTAFTIIPTPSATVVAVAPATDVTATVAPPVSNDTPATVEPQPAAPIATTKPAAVAPRATNTPVPASKPVGTTIAVIEPTAVPTVAPTATAAPTATVAPTATPAPTVVPTPTTPAIAVADKFKGAYAATANRLGSPIGGAQSVGTSQLFFQNGFMLYVAGQPIYVFYSGDHSFTSYANPGNSGAGSDGGAGPSAGLYKLVNAFGVVWTAQKLQSKLGYATSPGEAGGSGTLQAFENGSILSVGSDVYVLLKNGTWQPFSG